MPPILGSRAICLRHLLARSSSPTPAPSSMVPNVATLATAMRPSRRNLYSYSYDRQCRERYDRLTWRVLPVLVLLSCYGEHKQDERIKKLKESVAVLNEKEKEKEKEKTCCCCCAPPARGATTASISTADATAATTTTDAATTTDATAATTSHP